MISTQSTHTSPRSPQPTTAISGSIQHNGKTYRFSIQAHNTHVSSQSWEEVATKVAEFFQTNIPRNATIEKGKIVLSGNTLTHLSPETKVKIVKAKVTYAATGTGEKRETSRLTSKTEDIVFKDLHLTQTAFVSSSPKNIAARTSIVNEPVSEDEQDSSTEKAAGKIEPSAQPSILPSLLTSANSLENIEVELRPAKDQGTPKLAHQKKRRKEQNPQPKEILPKPILIKQDPVQSNDTNTEQPGLWNRLTSGFKRTFGYDHQATASNLASPLKEEDIFEKERTFLIELYCKDMLIAAQQTIKSSPEDCADILFDNKGKLTKEDLDFMHSSLLKNIRFGDLRREQNDLPVLPVRNTQDERELLFSGRGSENGELRGKLLQKKIELLKDQAEKQEMSLYDAIQTLVKE